VTPPPRCIAVDRSVEGQAIRDIVGDAFGPNACKMALGQQGILDRKATNDASRKAVVAMKVVLYGPAACAMVDPMASTAQRATLHFSDIDETRIAVLQANSVDLFSSNGGALRRECEHAKRQKPFPKETDLARKGSNGWVRNGCQACAAATFIDSGVESDDPSKRSRQENASHFNICQGDSDARVCGRFDRICFGYISRSRLHESAYQGRHGAEA
jgi:hypothetical protein